MKFGEFVQLIAIGLQARIPMHTWPWSRMCYAYGFTALGVALTVIAALGFSSMLAHARPIKPAVIKIDTSQQFRVTP